MFKKFSKYPLLTLHSLSSTLMLLLLCACQADAKQWALQIPSFSKIQEQMTQDKSKIQTMLTQSLKKPIGPASSQVASPAKKPSRGCAAAAAQSNHLLPVTPEKVKQHNDFVGLSQKNPHTSLQWRGKPFVMQGYQLFVPDAPNYCAGSLASYTQAIEAMVSNSNINTIRLWLLQSAALNGNFQYFDNAVRVAKQYGVKLVVTLVNQWGDCEPNNANNQKNFKTISWYTQGYRQTNDGYPLSYRDFVAEVVSRYFDEPTIAVWQLVNEAQSPIDSSQNCPNEKSSTQALRAFTDDMVHVIRQQDKNHLISLGTRNASDCGLQGSDYTYVHQAGVDLCEAHSYDPIAQALPTSLVDTQRYCPQKPLFVGELGLCQVPASDGLTCLETTPATPVQLLQRAQFFKNKWQAMQQANIVGALVWLWESDETYGVQKEDPLSSSW